MFANLTLSQIARHSGEAERHSLWPVFAFAPVFGYQGNPLRSIAGSNLCTNQGNTAYTRGRYGVALNYPDRTTDYTTLASPVAMGTSPHVFIIRCRNTSATRNGVASLAADTANNYIRLDEGNNRITTRMNSVNRNYSLPEAAIDWTAWHTWVLANYQSYGYRLVVDGVDYGTASGNGSLQTTFDQIATMTTYGFQGDIDYVGVIRGYVSVNDLLMLSRDPLLSFRKQSAFAGYIVPTGGEEPEVHSPFLSRMFESSFFESSLIR